MRYGHRWDKSRGKLYLRRDNLLLLCVGKIGLLRPLENLSGSSLRRGQNLSWAVIPSDVWTLATKTGDVIIQQRKTFSAPAKPSPVGDSERGIFLKGRVVGQRGQALWLKSGLRNGRARIFPGWLFYLMSASSLAFLTHVSSFGQPKNCPVKIISKQARLAHHVGKVVPNRSTSIIPAGYFFYFPKREF